MIEFTSTTLNIDPQAQRSAHLLSAVMSRALLDLMQKPSKEERKLHLNIDKNALDSARFFFGGNTTPFRTYSKMIGIDPDQFLTQLKNANHYSLGTKAFTPMQIRAMRLRIFWYSRQRNAEMMNEKGTTK